jgi:hypothetical protein
MLSTCLDAYAHETRRFCAGDQKLQRRCPDDTAQMHCVTHVILLAHLPSPLLAQTHSYFHDHFIGGTVFCMHSCLRARLFVRTHARTQDTHNYKHCPSSECTQALSLHAIRFENTMITCKHTCTPVHLFERSLSLIKPFTIALTRACTRA